MKLSDGTVLPSAFRASEGGSKHGPEHVKKSESLKVGTIIAVRTVDSTEGIQKSANNTKDGPNSTPYETVYDVKVDDHNARPFIFNGCRALKPWMGANNYFDMIHESSDLSLTYVEKGLLGVFTTAAESMVGSRCVLLCVEGAPTAPVILGFLQHPGRPSKIKKDKGLHMEMEFQGLNVSIDKDGAFKMIANGPYIPTATLPVGPVPESSIRANPLAGPFTVEITKDMQFILKDNKDQMIKLDRSAGEMIFTNGSETIKFTKPLVGPGESLIECSGTTTFKAVDGKFSFDKSWQISTGEMSVEANGALSGKALSVSLTANTSFEIKGQEVKINAQTSFALKTTTMKLEGATGELLAIVKELIEGIGKCTPASPVGPCAPIEGSPQWAALVALAIQKLAGLMG